MQPTQTQHPELQHPSRKTFKEKTKQTPPPNPSERQGQRRQKKKQGKKCVECTKHRKELRETKKENKHLKDTIRKAGTTERDLRNQFKELDWKKTGPKKKRKKRT